MTHPASHRPYRVACPATLDSRLCGNDGWWRTASFRVTLMLTCPHRGGRAGHPHPLVHPHPPRWRATPSPSRERWDARLRAKARAFAGMTGAVPRVRAPTRDAPTPDNPHPPLARPTSPRGRGEQARPERILRAEARGCAIDCVGGSARNDNLPEGIRHRAVTRIVVKSYPKVTVSVRKSIRHALRVAGAA